MTMTCSYSSHKQVWDNTCTVCVLGVVSHLMAYTTEVGISYMHMTVMFILKIWQASPLLFALHLTKPKQ